MAANKNILPIALVGVAAVLFLGGSAAANAASNADFQPETPPDTPPQKLSPSDFVKKYYPQALDSQNRTSVPAVVTLAQGAVESGWGGSAYGNNFFGIKADKSWTGDVQILKEWGCGKTGDPKLDGIKDDVIAIYKPGDPNGHPGCKDLFSYRVNARFRKYGKPADSFADHGYFLKAMPRYKNAFNYITDPKQFVIEIAKAGYASAPTYAADINALIDGIKKIIG